MLYQITDGSVSLGGVPVLKHIDFEIKGNEKIAVVGKNGAGKTTLLRLIAGKLELDQDDKRSGRGVYVSRRLTIGMLKQQAAEAGDHTVEEELLKGCPTGDIYERERFEYEREYDRLLTGFGLQKEDKKRKLSSFSGGEQTKLSLIRLLLAKPDILILDEPTNHLDLQTVEWLERYLGQYEKAVVIVSHDRFFLDQTVQSVWELSQGRLTRFPGNYTRFREEKKKQLLLRKKMFERQEQEKKRLEELIERFKHKPRKASFARSRKKLLERMTHVEKPTEEGRHLLTGEFSPLIPGSKWVLEAKHLKIGYKDALSEISLRIRRGQKIGVLGANGVGKTTFLKTAAGFLAPLAGSCTIGNQVTIGYFDQHSAEINDTSTVIEHFHSRFPSMTEKEVRNILGSYLFGSREAGKPVKGLSGGEKARLVLAELLQSRPNFLILDEPTNHMDLQAKEAFEAVFQAYTGTILFVSHDRYFVNQVAQEILIFQDQSVMYYPFGYEHYLERRKKQKDGGSIAAQIKAEEQSLIAGIQAVPRAERHQLREIPTEVAYTDWQLRLAAEKMTEYKKQVELLHDKLEKLLEEWRGSKEYWNGDTWQEEKQYEELKQEYDETMMLWGVSCIEWGDAAQIFTSSSRTYL